MFIFVPLSVSLLIPIDLEYFVSNICARMNPGDCSIYQTSKTLCSKTRKRDELELDHYHRLQWVGFIEH